MKLALLFSGLASVWSLLALLFSGPVEVGLEVPCFSAGLSPGGIPCVSLPKVAGSSGDCAPSSPRCLWGLADAYPDSDDVDRSPLVSCGSSSERADSLAADDAFDAVVDLQILIAMTLLLMMPLRWCLFAAASLPVAVYGLWPWGCSVTVSLSFNGLPPTGPRSPSRVSIYVGWLAMSVGDG